MENLPKSSMAFQLKDGNLLLISPEDIKAITQKLVVEGLADGKITLQSIKDSNVSKANILINLVATTKDMPDDLKRQYLVEILNLMTTPGEKEIETVIDNSKTQIT